MPDKTFDWYRTIVEIGNFEVEHSRTRFYENSKLHVALGAGSLGLASYALSSKMHLILVLPFLVSALGILNGAAWLRLLNASSWWDERWRRAAAELESDSDFRGAVGAAGVRVWSHQEVEQARSARERRPGATARYYQMTVWSWIAFHAILGASILIYGLAKWCRFAGSPGG